MGGNCGWDKRIKDMWNSDKEVFEDIKKKKMSI
jgi:hypothetical protein